jgi:D-alanine-D-alanine ligase
MTSQDVLGLKVVVIAGGWSDEKEISLDSGRACQKALTEAGFKGVDLLDAADGEFVSKLVAGGYDVAFVAMHGHYGEDGCIQGLLEILHMPYTFSGVLGSAVSTEKEVAKTLYRQAGIPTPRGTDVAAGTKLTDDDIDRVVDELGLPLFVKPAANGSSYGVTRVTSASQLREAVERASAGGDRVLIEECVTGTEITVPVIGNDDPKALPIVEIVTGAEFYNLKVKYEPSSMHHVIPARLEAGVYARAQELAVRAHRALGCLGASRSDFIVREDGTPVILETNTIPGMTENSLLPDSARHGGIEFPELCKKFVEYALEAHGKSEE